MKLNDFGMLFSKIRQEKAIIQEDMAKLLGVGLKTIQNWESGKIVPRRGKTEEIAKKLGLPITRFYPVPRAVEAIKTLADIFARGQFFTELWIFGTGNPFDFVSEESPALRQQMLDLIKDKEIKLNFVCPCPECDNLAQQTYFSYQQFRAQIGGLLEKDKEACLQNIKLVKVPDKPSADGLGLIDDWSSFICAAYSDEGVRKLGKVLDVWFGFVFNSNYSPDTTKEEWFWVELAKNEAESWWGRRGRMLKQFSVESAE